MSSHQALPEMFTRSTALRITASDSEPELLRVSVLAVQGLCGGFTDWLAWPDTEEVTGSIPVPPTMFSQVKGQFSDSGTGLPDHLSVVRPWHPALRSGSKR